MAAHRQGAGPRSDVTVLGAGIVGVCCALSLQERGLTVTLIDRNDPGEGASYGNAGVISPWSCVPQCLPGIWKSVPKWLLDPRGPVRVRFRDLPRLLPWAAAFLANTRLKKVQDIADTMDMLVRDNVAAYRRHLSGTGHEDLLRDSLFVNVFRGTAKPSLDDLPWKLRIERGAPVEIVGQAELRALEPALSDDVHSAVIIRDQARAYAPGKIAKVLADKAQRQGAKLLRCDVRGVMPNGHDGVDLHTDNGTLAAGKLVLCGGVWSAELLKPLGIKLPLIAERGYHLEFTDPGVQVNNTILDVVGKFIVSTMEDGLRSAGTSEFANVTAPPNYRRAEILKPLTKRLLPGLNTGAARRWMGTRPSFPDNLPVIGEVPEFSNLFVAFGHSHYGLGMAPATGRIIAETIVQATTNADRSRIGIQRFM